MAEPKKINIAIDGYSACGKSTLAQALARHLKYKYIDSGAMYRAVTLYAIRNKFTGDLPERLLAHLDQIHIDCIWSESGNKIYLNREDVTVPIRMPEIQELVSPVSTISQVRRFLSSQQKLMAANKGVVMDGRDIGTVVLPDAELKIFMIADLEVRTERRLKELLLKGLVLEKEEIKQNLIERDRIDSTRSDSPLKMAPGARILDNTFLDENAQFELALSWVKETLAGMPNFEN